VYVIEKIYFTGFGEDRFWGVFLSVFVGFCVCVVFWKVIQLKNNLGWRY
jgi:hypothetical protein